MSRKVNVRCLSVVMLFAFTKAFAHPPETLPEPYSWIPRNLIVKDAIYSATAVIDDATLSGVQVERLTGSDGSVDNADGEHTHHIYGATDSVFLTDDRGPGWWLADSEVFSASLTYRTRLLEQIKVNGYSWPLVMDGNHIAYQYRDDDSTMIAGFTIRRTAAMTAMAERNCRVEWTYLSSEFEPDAEVANGLWPVRGEPDGAVFNSVMN